MVREGRERNLGGWWVYDDLSIASFGSANNLVVSLDVHPKREQEMAKT